jgi:hypothetical protein
MSIRRRSDVASRLVLLLALVGAMLVVAAPASADSKVPTGTRIGIYRPPATFPANTPFYVQHGFTCETGTEACPFGKGNFSLYVDGVLQPSTVVVTNVDGVVAKYWLTNFPNGLPAGDHTLVGVWTFTGQPTQTVTDTITFT